MAPRCIPALVTLLLASAAPAQAQPAEDFFRGRQLNLIIGGGSAGAIDVYGRLVARHIVRFLPGAPNIVARNYPAAGGVQAYMQLGGTAPRDGSTFATSARGPITDPLFSLKPPTYDVRKFVWIGGMNEDSTVCYTHLASRFKTLGDARSGDVTMASTGALAESSKFPLALNATLGTRFKVINGYSGAAETHLAVEKRETEGRCTTVGSLNATHPDYIAQRKINILVQVGLGRRGELPEVPSALDLAAKPEDKQFLHLVIAPLAIAAAFALPPETPAERAAAWRNAFARTIRDEQFLQDARRIGLEVTPQTGDDIARVIDSIYATPQPVIDRAAQVFDLPR